MSDWLTFTILGAVQGLTEFLPISSSGHLILARDVFGFSDANGLSVDAILQLATALAAVAYFYKDILALLLGKQKKLFLALIAGTIPAVIFGLLLESKMETIFRSAHLVAYALLAGSLIMAGAEFFLKKYGKDFGMEGVSWQKGALIGLFQSLALVPGMSRSGMTISGGLFLGLSREAAAKFGFLLSIPIILGSGLKKLLELSQGGELASLGWPLFLGGIVAFGVGIAAIHGLLFFLRRKPLHVFIVYRVVLVFLILYLL